MSIMVTGEAEGKPDTVYIELSAEATAGNSADALAQCRQKADAAVETIKALSIANAEVLRDMYSFSSLAQTSPYGMSQPMSVPLGTKVSQIIRVKLKMAEQNSPEVLATKILWVLDAANKAGVGFKQPDSLQAQMSGEGASRPVFYVLEDATQLQKQAIKNGIARAKEVKASLTGSGVKAGKLLGVTYYLKGKDRVYYYGDQTDKVDVLNRNAVSSTSPEKVKVQCVLTNNYEVGEGQ